jgi:predicted transposase/invertase (TIGR01784 family)
MRDYVTQVQRCSECGAAPRPAPEIGPYVELMLDKNFKFFFASEERKDLLLFLLQLVLPELGIESVTLGPQEHIGREPGLKNSIFDVYATTKDNRRIIIEAQYSDRPDYLDRMLYYSTWPISEQINMGSKNNYALSEVYILSFINFALEHDSDWDGDFVSSYSVREDSNGEIMTRALHFRFVELGRFNKTEEELKNVREEWLYYLKNLGRMKEEIQPTGKEKATDKLLEAARYAGMAPKERNEYLQNMRNEFDIKTEKWYALQEGLAKGIAQGIEKGIAEGEARGRAEGKAEGKIEVAKNLIKLGMTSEQICRATGLTPEQVQAL